MPDTTAWAGVAWSADCTTSIYVVADAQERPYRVMRHRLGTPPADDVEVYRDDDARFYVGIGTTRSRVWIVIRSAEQRDVGELAAADRRPGGARRSRARHGATASNTTSTTGATAW